MRAELKSLALTTITLIVLGGCNPNSKSKHTARQEDTVATQKKATSYSLQDSIALLQLTQNLYRWNQTGDNDDYFSPVLKENNDTLYAGLDMKLHQQKLQKISEAGLFSKTFISNYNKIAMTIDAKIKDGTLQWKIGELPPFGNGANLWCNCQDLPDDFLSKLHIMHLRDEKDGIFYNWAWGDGIVYNLKALKENNQWKISEMEGFDYDSFVGTFQKQNDFTGKWGNEMVTLNIGKTSLAFEYHGQCVYFYPVKKISDTEFEMIWARDMDCKFDNGTKETFGLKAVPQLGKPFAKFIIKNGTLYAEYYYAEWVKRYTAQVQDNVFTPKYSRKNENN
ncbi:hypothetical protein QFZ20_000689 [Flavobacterium sp. W4I14]|nr:hypothetical protein [Flavobacterium sp. W4I14]